MFKLNEAPNAILAAMSAHQTQRNCGTFWSILCCIPTVGISIGCCESNSKESWLSCCYPHSVEIESHATVAALQDALQKIRIKPKDAEASEGGNLNAMIEWQVKETLKVVKKALDDNVISGSYKDALLKVYKKVSTKALHAEEFGQVLASEVSPLTGAQPYAPNYRAK